MNCWDKLRVMVLAAAVVGAGALARPAAGQAASHGAGSGAVDVAGLFGEGEAALRAGDLDAAAAAFKKVLGVDPGAAGAYANLGVIAMRRQQWGQALEMLRKAEGLAPGVAGIRFEHWIGLLPAERFSCGDCAV